MNNPTLFNFIDSLVTVQQMIRETQLFLEKFPEFSEVKWHTLPFQMPAVYPESPYDQQDKAAVEFYLVAKVSQPKSEYQQAVEVLIRINVTATGHLLEGESGWSRSGHFVDWPYRYELRVETIEDLNHKLPPFAEQVLRMFKATIGVDMFGVDI